MPFYFRKLKESGQDTTDVPIPSERLTLSDEVRRLSSIKMDAKIKSSSLLCGTTGELRAAVTLANNTIDLYSLNIHDGGEGNVSNKL